MYSELGEKIKLLRKRRNLSLKQLEKICEYFQIDMSYFLISETTDCCMELIDKAKLLFKSNDKQSYWRKLKQRLRDEGNETVTNCHALKLKAQVGKYRLTDVTDIEGMFRIIESIPSKNAEPLNSG